MSSAVCTKGSLCCSDIENILSSAVGRIKAHRALSESLNYILKYFEIFFLSLEFPNWIWKELGTQKTGVFFFFFTDHICIYSSSVLLKEFDIQFFRNSFLYIFFINILGTFCLWSETIITVRKKNKEKNVFCAERMHSAGVYLQQLWSQKEFWVINTS